jgi:hypothetical protein
MKARIFLVGALGVFLAAGCSLQTVRGSGNIIREARGAHGFTRIEACCGMEIKLTQEDRFSLELEGDDNLLEEIETLVRGDTLVVRYLRDQAAYLPTRGIQVYLSMPEIERVELSGGGELRSDRLQADFLSIQMSGGSHAFIDFLLAGSLDVEISGGGSIRLAGGEVGRQTVDLSGGSGIFARDLKTQDTVIQISGGGQGEVWATELLDADLSGGSQLEYYGHPRVAEETSGGSTLSSRGDK